MAIKITEKQARDFSCALISPSVGGFAQMVNAFCANHEAEFNAFCLELEKKEIRQEVADERLNQNTHLQSY